METNLLDRNSHRCKCNSKLNRHNDAAAINQAKSELQLLERSYRKSSRTLQSLVLSMVFAVLVVMAFGLFGGRVDREKFTTEVTPVHIELNSISGSRQTAARPSSMQM